MEAAAQTPDWHLDLQPALEGAHAENGGLIATADEVTQAALRVGPGAARRITPLLNATPDSVACSPAADALRGTPGIPDGHGMPLDSGHMHMYYVPCCWP